MVRLLISLFAIVASVSSLTKVVGVPSCSKELTPVFTLQHTNITGVLTRSLPTPLLLDCSEHCASSSDCIGVEYWQAQGICRVIGASKTETYDITDETSVLLTKSCVKSDRICSSPFHFDVHEQKILIGFAREVVPAESVENCMSACLNAFDTFGFECESAMFYPVDSECILNTEDRLDRADLFVDEKEDTVLYLDSNCAGSQCYAPYITQYIAVEGKQIENELDRKFDNIDFQSCEELCTGKVTVTSNEFTCKSFMYNSEDNVCYLSDERSKPLGRATLVNATGFTYYEKKCFASPRTCRATASFQRVPQKILVGFAAFVMENVPSVTMCLDQCTNPPPETSSDKDKPFECRSVMYYYNEMECILNAETRLSKPDLFIPEGDDFVVDYFDISCHLDAETCPQGTSLRGIKSINAALPEGDGSLHVIESAGTGVAECMSKCLALAPEKCRSFNFEKKTGLCNLLYLDGKTTLRPYVKSGFDLIDLQCLSTQPDCSPGKSGVIYTKYLYSQQSGLATKTEKVVAISACLNKCSEAEKCSGVNYNRRSGECSYFESVDDVSELKKSDHVDFYINLCLVKENSAAISSAINVPQIIVSNKTASVSTKEEKLLNLTGKVQKPHLREQEQARRKGVNGENSVAEGASTDEEKKTEEATTKTVESKSEGKTIDGSAPVVEVTTTGTKSGPAPTPILISADRVQTVCDYDGIKVQIKSPQSFTGVIFVKNHYESCRVEVTGADSATLELGLPASFGMKPIAISSSNATVGDSATISTRKRRETPAVKSCGITETENGKYKSTVVVQTNNLGIAGLVTSTDQIYEIGCDYSSMLGGKITTAANMTVNGPTPTDIKPRGKIELGNPVLMQMNAGSGDHQPVLQAKLGDILELKWEIMAMDDELDFFVKDCHAEPGTATAEKEKLQLIEGGCPTPAVAQKLMPQPIKVSKESSAVKIAHLQAFRFDSASSVKITCSIEICKGNCAAVKCDMHGETKESWGRKKRSLENSVTDFETQRYKVPRFSQATTSLVIMDPMQNSVEPLSSMSKISSQDLFSEDPADALLRISQSAHLKGNICLAKYTIFSVFGVLFALIFIQAVVVTHYCFKRFMTTPKKTGSM